MLSRLTACFASMPYDTFTFEAHPNYEFVDVTGSKQLENNKIERFDAIEININGHSKEVCFTFIRSFYSSNQIFEVIDIIKELYRDLGEDTRGDTRLNATNIRWLSEPLLESYVPVSIWWKTGTNHISLHAETNERFSISFFDIPIKDKDAFIQKYYTPYIQFDKRGILVNRYKQLNQVIAKVISDEFTKETIIGVTQVIDKDKRYLYSYSFEDDKEILLPSERTKIGVSFAYSMGFFLIDITSHDGTFQLDIGDTMIFLFEGEEIIEIDFTTSPRYEEDVYTNNALISNEQLKIFCTNKLKKWKLVSSGKKLYKVGGFFFDHLIEQYKGELEGQYVLQTLAKAVVDCAIKNDAPSFDSHFFDNLHKADSSITAPQPNNNLNPEQTLEEVLAELDSLIGLKRVKEEVRTLTNYIKVQKAREASGLKASNLSYHVIFTGNPGTGKTTVARILSQIYKCLGLLNRGHLVEIDRSGLIAEYLGQTAPKVNKVIDSALNGILFIDEAYSIVTSKTDDYGKEAVATLLKRIEDDRHRLAVILAGYNDEMKDFINTNPGFSSRFNRYIHFPDYSPDELVSIFETLCLKNEYVLELEAKYKVEYVIEQIYTDRDRSFGNGRYVRNLFEKTLESQANRLSHLANYTKEDLLAIKAVDVPSVTFV